MNPPNGNSGDRLDRIERTLEAIAEDRRADMERHKAAMAEIEARLQADLRRHDAVMAEIADRHQAAMAQSADQRRSDLERHQAAMAEIDWHHRARMAELELHRVEIDSLNSNIHELFESSQRHDAQIAALLEASARDGEHIRALARIAEIHDRRLRYLEENES